MRHLCRNRGRQHLAYARCTLGEVWIRQGRTSEAIALLQWCVRAFQDIPDRSGEASALRQLAQARAADGDHLVALDLVKTSIAVATQVGAQQLRGQGLLALGDLCAAIGDGRNARKAWSEASVTLQELGSPEADAARARLVGRHTDPQTHTPS